MKPATAIRQVQASGCRALRTSRVPSRCPRKIASVSMNSATTKAVKPSEASEASASPIDVLRDAATTLAVPPKLVLQAMTALEDQKLEPDSWVDHISAPSARWRLVYSAGSKAVVKAKKGDTKVSGQYFPIPACQKFDKDPAIITNGVFLGALAYLIFAGPYEVKKRKLEFDFTFLTLGVGPFKATIPLKKDGVVVDQIAGMSGDKDMLKKKLPFFLYVYADEGIVVARGASGGLALWVNADTEWQAKSGVLRVYQ